jgi:hypothetical protein
MSRKTALIIAGVITSVVMVLVVAVAGGASWFSQRASAASSGDPASISSAALSENPADVAALQAELLDYQAALQQANTQLQAAYDEIAALQTQGRFPGEREEYEHEYEQSGRFFSPFEED